MRPIRPISPLKEQPVAQARVRFPRIRVLACAAGWVYQQAPIILLATALSLPACASMGDISLLGYTTTPQFTSNIRTVRVPILENRTFVRGIEFQLTEEIIKQIEAKTPWKVVQSGNADAELSGIIINTLKRHVSPNPLNEVREAEVSLGVEVTWRDLRTGLAVQNQGNEFLGPVPGGPLPNGPLTPPPPRPVFVQRNAPFIPELGESTETARQEAVNDLAEQIVSMLETPW